MFIAAAALYLFTAQRGPAWQDSGIFQWRMHVCDIKGQMGIALAHPLSIILGHLLGLVPLGPEVWRYNAFPALAMAVAVANLAVLVRRLTPRAPAAAVLAAGAFGLAHTVWWLATITESHALMAAIMTGELLVLVRLLRRPNVIAVLALGLLNGLGASTHNLALLALPAYGLTVVVLSARRRLSFWAVPAFVAAWLAGASPLLSLTATEAARSGWPAAVSSALFGAGWQSQVVGFAWRAVGLGLAYIVLNFLNLSLPLAAVGLARLKRAVGTPLAAILAYLLAAHFVFAVRYTVPDQFMFFVPLYVVIAVLAGVGLSTAADSRRRAVTVAALALLAVGPVVYAVAPTVMHRMNVRLGGYSAGAPGRDSLRYWLTPWKNDEDSAGRFARAAVAQLQAQGAPTFLYAPSTAHAPLKWVLATTEATDAPITLMGGWGDPLMAMLEDRPGEFWQTVRRRGASVWVVSVQPGYCPPLLRELAGEKPDGMLYRVTPPSLGE